MNARNQVVEIKQNEKMALLSLKHFSENLNIEIFVVYSFMKKVEDFIILKSKLGNPLSKGILDILENYKMIKVIWNYVFNHFIKYMTGCNFAPLNFITSYVHD